MVERVAVNHCNEGSNPSQVVISGSLMAKCLAHNGSDVGSIQSGAFFIRVA